MQKLARHTAILLVLLLGTAAADQVNDAPSNRKEGGRRWLVGGIQTGYYSGLGFHLSATAQNFAQDFPFAVRLGLGYARVPAGDEWAARRVFINDNTNGTARSNAHVWDVRLDVLYPMKILNLKRTTLFAGPRHSDFDAYFEYIGGAETFDVITKQWGIGGGVETAFALSPLVDMVFSVGADYYFRGTLGGHDTYYSPDGDDVHPIEDYTYAEADKAINQPDVITRVMMGLAYHF
jgi:hypothetical protein